MTEQIYISSITQVHELLGLKKNQHPLVSIVRQMPSMGSEFDDIRVHLGLYAVSMKNGMSGSFQYGRRSYDFQEGTITFIAPGQVLSPQASKSSDDAKNWTLLFHPDLIRRYDLGRNINEYSFFSYEADEALHLSDEEKKSLADLSINIENEIHKNIDQHTHKLIVANIELMLDYCKRYYDRQFYTRSHVNKDTVASFEKILRDYYQTNQQLEHGIPTVTQCATHLSLSANYLSDLLKKETGRNAREHIHYYIIERAKTELLNSDQRISDIAYSLGFGYPSHFTKLFKSNTGTSPTDYRKLH